MNVAQDIAARRAEIVAALLKISPRVPGVSEEEARQFVAGYLHLVEQAGAGNTDARDDYLATVIPGVKQAGMPLGFIMRILVAIDIALVPLVAPEHRAWVADYCADYAERLVNAWIAA